MKIKELCKEIAEKNPQVIIAITIENEDGGMRETSTKIYGRCAKEEADILIRSFADDYLNSNRPF